MMKLRPRAGIEPAYVKLRQKLTPPYFKQRPQKWCIDAPNQPKTLFFGFLDPKNLGKDTKLYINPTKFGKVMSKLRRRAGIEPGYVTVRQKLTPPPTSRNRPGNGS